jgi:DNA-binding MarR family transcriptional regulator
MAMGLKGRTQGKLPDSRILGDPGTDAFRIDRYPFYLLNRLVSRYNLVIGVRLKTIGLDIPQWRVLMVLGESRPLGVSDIADRAVINLSTATRIVQRMVSAGLLKVNTSRTDSRVTEADLTPRGLELLASARAATTPVYKTVIRSFDARRFEDLIESLACMHANLDEEG